MLGRGQSRHVGRHDDDEDRHHGLELDPVGIASKGGIARLYLKHRQKVPLQSAGNDENAAKQGKLEDQQASVFRSDQARYITDKVPGQQRPADQDDAHRDDREPRKAAQDDGGQSPRVIRDRSRSNQ